MTSEIERQQHAAEVALWRDTEGFSRIQETEPGSGVFYVMGPDDLSHAVFCNFIQQAGILPCSCDDTRREYSRGPAGEINRSPSWWGRCWRRWAEARVKPEERRRRVPWPVEGPDGEPWVEGLDFTGDDDTTLAGPPDTRRPVNVEWGVRDKWGVHAMTSDAHARQIVERMRPGSASVVCREAIEWREADNWGR